MVLVSDQDPGCLDFLSDLSACISPTQCELYPTCCTLFLWFMGSGSLCVHRSVVFAFQILSLGGTWSFSAKRQHAFELWPPLESGCYFEADCKSTIFVYLLRGRSQLSTFMKAYTAYARGEGVWDHSTLFPRKSTFIFNHWQCIIKYCTCLECGQYGYMLIFVGLSLL